MKSSIICGIDVGNSYVKTVIAELSREDLTPRIIGIGTAPSNGLRRGTIVDMDEATQSVRASVEQAELMAGIKVASAFVSINGLHIKTQTSRGVIAVSRADNEIVQSDIARLIEAASTVSLPLNYEIVHVIPKTFIIDGHEQVKNALGMKGVRLEVEVLLVEGLSPYIRNLIKCINANGIEVQEFVFAPLAAAKAVLDKHQREYGVMLVDLGGGVSNLALFHEGDLLHTAVLPIGSRHVTNDIAIAFRTSMDNAELIKVQHGVAGTADLPSSKKDLVDLSSIIGEDVSVPKRHIAKIIDARINELFDVVIQEMKKPGGTRLLPAGLVLAGGGANLAGLANYAKDRLGLSVKLSGDYQLEGISESLRDPSYAVAVGLVLWGTERMQHSGPAQGSMGRAFSGNFLKKTVAWLKNFMP